VAQTYLRKFGISLLIATPIYYFFMGGFSSLKPKNFQWISGDNTSGYVAQLFFLSDTWRIPIGANPNFGLDLSTSVTYSGPPLPILLTQKLLRINPELQFIGIWLLLMIILQIMFGILITRQIGYGHFESIILGTLFVTPFFLYRFQVHYWLTAHFLILWAFWISLRCLSRRTLLTYETAIFLLIAYSINTYILLMTIIVLSYPLLISVLSEKKINLEARKHALAIFTSLSVSYLVIDFRAQAGTLYENLRMNFTGGYTENPSNVLALFNPAVGYSRNCEKGHCIFGNLPVPETFVENFSLLNYDLGGVQGNFDGFLYLGLGILSLVAIVALHSILTSRVRLFNVSTIQSRLLIIYTFLVSAYAITYKVSVGNYQIDLGDPKLLRWALSMFRASGRFMWLVAYLIIILLLIYVHKFIEIRKMRLIVIVAITLQLIDVTPRILDRYHALGNQSLNSIKVEKEFEQTFAEFALGKEILVMYPPGTQEGWPQVSYLAWKNNLRSSMSQSSRVNGIRRELLENEIHEQICTGTIPKNWLLIIPPSGLRSISSCIAETYLTKELNSFMFVKAN
jgi:hypothetical protein